LDFDRLRLDVPPETLSRFSSDNSVALAFGSAGFAFGLDFFVSFFMVVLLFEMSLSTAFTYKAQARKKEIIFVHRLRGVYTKLGPITGAT
jgi:hypothetical protein